MPLSCRLSEHMFEDIIVFENRNNSNKLHDLENGKPAVLAFYLKTLNRCYYMHYRDDLIHSDPTSSIPTVAYYYLNGNYERMYFYDSGLIHSHPIQGPSFFEFNENRDIIGTTYYYYGKIHNEINPARIYYDNDGNRISVEYMINGKYDRFNKPAYITYHPNGNINTEIYYINGKEHRDNHKPSTIVYDEEGRKKYEYYCVNDHMSNYNGDSYGPIYIEYAPDGSIVRQCIDDGQVLEFDDDEDHEDHDYHEEDDYEHSEVDLEFEFILQN